MFTEIIRFIRDGEKEVGVGGWGVGWAEGVWR